MMMNLYCIYDEKAQAHNVPFAFNHDGQATRAFEDEAKNQQSAIAAHPSDYKLYRIGTYDTDTAEISPVVPGIYLMSGDQIQTEMEI